MKEQIAVLVQHQNEWVFVIDDEGDNEPEGVWQDFEEARKELNLEGWQITDGAGAIRLTGEGLPQVEIFGYRLRRGIQ